MSQGVMDWGMAVLLAVVAYCAMRMASAIQVNGKIDFAARQRLAGASTRVVLVFLVLIVFVWGAVALLGYPMDVALIAANAIIAVGLVVASEAGVRAAKKGRRE